VCPDWPQTHDPPASALPVLELPACPTMPGSATPHLTHVFLYYYSVVEIQYRITWNRLVCLREL
jgi:hypothetical protein